MTAAAVLDVVAARADLDGAAPVVAFDADGTLWAGDIGGTAAQRDLPELNRQVWHDVVGPRFAARTGVEVDLGPDGPRTMGADFDAHRLPHTAAMSLEVFTAQTTCWAGQTDDALRAVGRAVFAEHIAAGTHPAVGAFLCALVERGARAYVVSASPAPFVEAAVRALQLPVTAVFGARAEVDDDGRWTSRVALLPQGPAKVDVLAPLLDGGRLWVAAGDTPRAGDAAMLAAAVHAFAVGPGGTLSPLGPDDIEA